MEERIDEKEEACGVAMDLRVMTLDFTPRRRILNRRQISPRFVVDEMHCCRFYLRLFAFP